VQIKWLTPAVIDLQRLRDFILPHNTDASRRAVKVIRTAVTALASTPHIGKPVEDMPDYRDLVIPFGSAGYLLRYRIQADAIYIVALRHCREAGYFEDKAPAFGKD
jgi:plasmid stabilization system protein ParE